MKSWVSAPPARWTQSGVKGFWSASTTVRTRLSVRSRAPSTYSRPRSSRAGRPSSRGRSRAAHGHQSLSGAELAWRTSLVRHLESDLPQTHQTQPSHPLRDLVLAVLLPFVMIDLVGLTPTQFGLAMICQTGSYMLGAAVTGRALRRIPAARLIPVGVVLGVVAGLWLAIGLRLVRPSFISVMGPVAIWAFGVALIMPGTTTSALAAFPTIAGAAAALTGFLQIGGSPAVYVD